MAEYNQTQRLILLELAAQSIEYGCHHGNYLEIHTAEYPENLLEHRACFVTLHKHQQLRGCIGTLYAVQPLLLDIRDNAFKAAFQDHRFTPVSADELDALQLDISVLSIPQPMTVESEEDLLKQLNPNTDGLILKDKAYQATFLPSVWAQLPDKDLFVKHLKQKAGFPDNYWSDSIEFYRYFTESFG